MANPTQDWLTAGAASALEGTIDAETGARYMDHDQGPVDDPSSYTETTSAQYHALCLLGKTVGGVVLASKNGGLNVAVWGIPRYRIGATAYTLPGTDPFACTDNSTCYLYCGASQVVEENVGAWPSGDHLKLAVVTTSGGAVTTIAPALFENHLIGSENEWYNVAAGGNVDLAGYDLDDVGTLNFDAATDLEVSSGTITPTQSVHRVYGEGEVDDYLDTITATAATKGHLLLLRPKIGGDPETDYGTVTLRATGNIELANEEDFDLSTYYVGEQSYYRGHAILLLQRNDTTWVEVSRSHHVLMALENNLSCGGFNLFDVGELNVQGLLQAISSGALSFETTYTLVDTEAAASSDDLDTITGGQSNSFLFIRPWHTDHTVVVKHGIGSNKVALQNGLDFTMDTTEHFLILQRSQNGTQWVEVARSPQRLRDLVTTADEDRCIPYSPGEFFYSGALSAGVYVQEIHCPVAFTIKNITGRVPLAGVPGGGPCIIDLHDDGVSIFSNESEMINIAAGTQQDTSAAKDHQVAAGSILRIEVKSTSGSPNGADNAHVSINGYIAPQTAP